MTTSQLTPLYLEATGQELDGRAMYKVDRDWVYEGQIGIRVVVPAGFLTDFASVPTFLWPIFPPSGRHERAALLHDFLYSKAGNCTRHLADAMFREAMGQLGVPLWERWMMWFAVRVFGKRAYRVK